MHVIMISHLRMKFNHLALVTFIHFWSRCSEKRGEGGGGGGGGGVRSRQRERERDSELCEMLSTPEGMEFWFSFTFANKLFILSC